MTITFRDVSFGYPRRPLFDHLELELGCLPCVILGPNGAGKSTLLALLAGHLRPRHGEVTLGRDSTARARGRQRIRRRVGWLPQDVRPIAGMNLREQVAYAGWLKGMPYRAAWTSAAAALEQVDLAALAGRSAGRLSGGQRRRLGIAQTIVNAPEFLVLDEPYAGLDPEQRAGVRDTLLALAPTTGLIVSTHQTEELEDVYASVLVLSAGAVRYQGPTVDFFKLAPAAVPSTLRAEAAYRHVVGAVRA